MDTVALEFLKAAKGIINPANDWNITVHEVATGSKEALSKLRSYHVAGKHRLM